MTDANQATKVGFIGMALTATGSTTIGDQLGNSLAEVLTWCITLGCHCVPPIAVIEAFHTLILDLTVIAALCVHYKFAAKTSN